MFTLEDIVSWVATNKLKTERDRYKGGSIRSPHGVGDPQSDNTIAQRILAVINQGGHSFFTTGTSGQGMENPLGLGQWLVARHPEIFGNTSLTNMPESITDALKAVLEFWYLEMDVTVGARMMSEIDKAIN